MKFVARANTGFGVQSSRRNSVAACTRMTKRSNATMISTITITRMGHAIRDRILSLLVFAPRVAEVPPARPSQDVFFGWTRFLNSVISAPSSAIRFPSLVPSRGLHGFLPAILQLGLGQIHMSDGLRMKNLTARNLLVRRPQVKNYSVRGGS